MSYIIFSFKAPTNEMGAGGEEVAFQKFIIIIIFFLGGGGGGA